MLVSMETSEHDIDAIYLVEQELTISSSASTVGQQSLGLCWLPCQLDFGISRANFRLSKYRPTRPRFAHALFQQTSRLLL